MLDNLIKTEKRLFSKKLKTTESKSVFVIVQDNIDPDSNNIGYSLFLPFITEQINNKIIINNSNVKISGVRRLFTQTNHIERDENTLLKYIRHIVFESYDSAKTFIEFLDADEVGLYKPIIMQGEIPENKHYFNFRDGIFLSETFRLCY